MSTAIRIAAAIAALLAPLSLATPAHADDSRPDHLVLRYSLTFNPADSVDGVDGSVLSELAADGVNIGDTVPVTYAPCPHGEHPSETCMWHGATSLGAVGFSHILSPTGFDIPLSIYIRSRENFITGEVIWPDTVYATDPSKPGAVNILEGDDTGWVGNAMDGFRPLLDDLHGMAGVWSDGETARKDGVTYLHVATGTIDFWAPESALAPMWPDGKGDPLHSPSPSQRAAGTSQSVSPVEPPVRQASTAGRGTFASATSSHRGVPGWLIIGGGFAAVGLASALAFNRKRHVTGGPTAVDKTEVK